MPTHSPRSDWNEIPFLSRREFQDMAPSILQLEITRLSRLIERVSEEADVHNGLVRARFELRQFIDGLERAGKDSEHLALAHHLRVAIMNLGALPEGLNPETGRTCRYVLDRLQDVYARITHIY